MKEQFNAWKDGLANLGISTLEEDGIAKSGYDIMSELSEKFNKLRNPTVNIDVNISPSINHETILNNMHQTLMEAHEHKWEPIVGSTDVECKICGIRAKRFSL